MAELLKGSQAAAALEPRIREGITRLGEKGVVPALAVVRVGERGDDVSYERSICKRCATFGVEVRKCAFETGVSQQELLECIEALNRDETIHGVLIFRPLPENIDSEAVCRVLALEKDVDGITDGSLAGMFSGSEKGFAPCTPQACMEILDCFGIDPKGKRAVIVGRSLVVGKPAAMMLLAKHATVTICHTRTVDLPARCREAEILVVAAGQAGAVGRDCFSPGQVVIDVGINVGEDGSLCGDVVFAEAEPIVKAITPVPGGVGAATTQVLAYHVVQAAVRQQLDKP